jgi:light-regulated signal transduction histidine kinase (bacteriophytochrome)
MIGTAQDITERKNAEEELAAVHAKLERRTMDLERSNLELEQFAYDASHDLGEPLRVMSRLAGALAEVYEDRLDDDGRRLVTSIMDGAERMKMLIDDLLAYSRAAREPLERSWVNCQAAFEDALDLLAESVAEKDATVTAEGLPTIEVNRAQFRQLLQNLLSNALKFAADEPLRIRVAAQRQDGAWEFSMADNGIGVDPYQAERVFELFRRLKPNDAYAGTGMGLAICKRIVDRHGGKIWVEPGDAGGSVFRFTVPDRQTGLEAVLCGGS